MRLMRDYPVAVISAEKNGKSKKLKLGSAHFRQISESVRGSSVIPAEALFGLIEKHFSC